MDPGVSIGMRGMFGSSGRATGCVEGVGANVDRTLSTDKLQQPGASDLPHRIRLLDGQINNLIELLIDEDRLWTSLAVWNTMLFGVVPSSFSIDSEEDPNLPAGCRPGKSPRFAKCETHSYDSFSCFAATFQDLPAIQDGDEIVHCQGHVRIGQSLTESIGMGDHLEFVDVPPYRL